MSIARNIINEVDAAFMRRTKLIELTSDVKTGADIITRGTIVDVVVVTNKSVFIEGPGGEKAELPLKSFKHKVVR